MVILLMVIGGYYFNGYMAAILLMAIGGYYFNGYLLLFYKWILVTILLMIIINVLLMVINGYFIDWY